MDEDNDMIVTKDQRTLKIIKEEKTPGCYLKARFVLAFMSFLGLFNLFAFRTSLSVAIVAMVNSSAIGRSSNSSCSDRNRTTQNSVTANGYFDWNGTQQGLVLGCYFYGYLFSNIPGGWMGKKYGVRMLIGISMTLSSVITLLMPALAKTSFSLFALSRVLLGLFQGVTAPAMFSSWSVWVPSMERSTLISFVISGTCLGAFVTLLFYGVIAEILGWEAIFYFNGGCALIWSVIWIAIIRNSPEEHPRISKQELNYILKNIAEEKMNSEYQEGKTRTPWVGILTSPPFWSIVAAHFAYAYGLYTLMALLPTYMTFVLRFNFTAAGAFSALPYLLQFIVLNVAGYLTDMIRRRRIMDTVTIRKLNSALGLLLPAVFIVLASYIGCDVSLAIAFFSLSLAVCSLNVPGCQANNVDIAPKYSGIVFGTANTIANLAGILAPQIAGFILTDYNSISQWRLVFWVSAIVQCGGAIIYILFASAKVQPWANGSVVVTAKKDALVAEII